MNLLGFSSESVVVFQLVYCICLLFTGDRIMSYHRQKLHEVIEIGIMYPTETATDVL